MSEAPFAWSAPAPEAKIARTPRRAAVAAVAGAAAAVPSPDQVPDTLEALAQLYATHPFTGLSNRRIAAAGDPGAALMVLLEMPEANDNAMGQLLSGDVGALFDKMLAALGLDRQHIWLAAMVPARPAAPLIAAEAAYVAALARQHVALIAPPKLWLMGRAPSRALLGMDETQAIGRLHDVNHKGGTTRAIASVHPQVLLQLPKRKAEVWADMQKLIKE